MLPLRHLTLYLVCSQNIALQTLSSLTSLLQSKTKEDYASESNLVEEGGENLVLSFGNLLNSAAQKASVIENAKEPEVIQTEVNYAM